MLKNKNVHRLFYLILIFLLFGCKQQSSYPEIQNMDEFRRSFFNDGESFVTSNFDESIIKSGVIVRAHLTNTTPTDEGYVIYEFDVVDSIKNPKNDTHIWLYEPTLKDGRMQYENHNDYLLLLSRTIDVYDPNPIYFNFGFVEISIDEHDQLDIATAKEDNLNLKEAYSLKTYADIVDYISKVRTENTSIKDGIYDYHGRFIDSDDPLELIETADYLVEVKLEEILHQNRLLQESLFLVEKSYKNKTDDHIIISIPSNVALDVGHSYLVALFKDGNYTVASRTSVIPMEKSSEVELFQSMIFDYLDKQATLKSLNQTDSLLLELPPVLKQEREWVINELYQPYVDINEDMVGWFKIEDTVIDYPVLQGTDNTYYLKHDINDEPYYYGSIILDYRCDIQNIARNTMIYGHNMKQKIMFHEIVNYKNKEFLDSHPIIEFNTLYDTMKWEVFAVYVVDGGYVYCISYPLAEDEEFQAYIDAIEERNMFQTDISVGMDDKILTLVTCSYEFDNARTIVHARLIQD